MKKILFVFAIAFAVVACKNDKQTETANETVVDAKTEAAEVVPTSYVWWKGDKVVSGSHNGKIEFSEIDLKTEGDKLVGGEFVVDMTTMTCDDLEGEKAKDLIGHLSNEDFFEVGTYPTAKFKILEVGDGEMTGALTIKDVTKNITVPVTYAVSGENVKMKSDFTFDRSDFNVKFNSPSLTDVVKEKAIKDEIELKVVIAK